ncbi:MAG: SsrA-binding protein SmpB [Candidatus Dojkabacteria bacterium]|nr:SsrA-binding protein SmpB [Candidatus Dojkabacteria bacterium]
MKIVNKKAHHNYNVKDSFEAGIVLTGSEVKSIRNGRCNLSDAYVKFLGNDLYLINADIAKYTNDGSDGYDSSRSRKLLLKRKEIESLRSKMKQGRLVLFPLSVYTSRNLIKVEVGLGSGKRNYEKKSVEKDRDVKREMARIRRKHMV